MNEKLIAEVVRLCIERDRFWNKGEKLHTEARKLHIERDKLHCKASNLYNKATPEEQAEIERRLDEARKGKDEVD